MGRTDDDVQHRRMRRDDVGQRRDRELVALARTEETEAEDDLAALHAEARLDRVGVDEREVRHAVRDDVQPAPARRRRRCSAGRPRIATSRRWRRSARRARSGWPAAWRRVPQDGVKRRDRRDRRAPGEVEDVLAVLAAPDPVLVLDRDDVDASCPGPRPSARGRRARPSGSGDGPRPDTPQTPARAGWRATTSRWPLAAARSWVNVAIPQCRGGYVATKAVRTMTRLPGSLPDTGCRSHGPFEKGRPRGAVTCRDEIPP